MRCALATCAALLLGGCGGGDGGTTVSAPSAEPRLEQTCERPDGITVSYPAGWHTNPGDRIRRCRCFHPKEFELGRQTEASGIAISLEAAPVPFDELTEQVGGSPAREQRRREALTVDGRDAVRIEGVATGQALLPEGTPVTTYYVDLGERTLVATTAGTSGLDYEGNRRVLEWMVESVRVSA